MSDKRLVTVRTEVEFSIVTSTSVQWYIVPTVYFTPLKGLSKIINECTEREIKYNHKINLLRKNQRRRRRCRTERK